MFLIFVGDRSMNPDISQLTTLELAQALADRLRISESDWHRLKSNRARRAQEQAAAGLVLLLSEQTADGLAHLQQAAGWLDRSVSAPPCPTHGNR
jgi:Family of unknown function (DUF6439)